MEENKDTKPIDKILTRAKRNLKKGMTATEHNYIEALADLKFCNGEQWDKDEKEIRKNDSRPALVFNFMPKFIDQVVGDQRQNRPSIKIRPESTDANVHNAKIIEGMVRDIQYQSKSEMIYDQAFESKVRCGWGGWRVLTQYVNDESFNKEIIIRPIPNPFCIILDPDAKMSDGSDAKWGFVLEKMSHEDFMDKYPEAGDPSDLYKNAVGTQDEHWYDKNSVLVVEYFEKEITIEKKVLLSDGRVMSAKEAETYLRVPPPEEGVVTAPSSPSITKLDERDVEVSKIQHYILNGNEILEGPKLWPGKYIPLIQDYGKETNIEGKRYVRGLTRYGKDAQRMLNYLKTLAVETVALAPKAPFKGTPAQIAGFEGDWENINKKNLGIARFNMDPDFPNMTGPERIQPANPPIAIFTEIQQAEADLESIMNMHEASLGAKSNETSGKAIINRQRKGDIGNFAFIDNHIRAIEYTGRIIVDLIPHIYDTERDIRIRNDNGTDAMVPINTTVNKVFDIMQTSPGTYQVDIQYLKQLVVQRGPMADFNNVTKGLYNISVTAGPSYATQRIESAEHMLELIQSVPIIGEIGGDLLVKNLDFNDAEELSRRIRKKLPPGTATPTEEDKLSTPIQPNPLMMAKLQESIGKAMKYKAEAMKAMTESQQGSNDQMAQMRAMILDTLAEVFEPPKQLTQGGVK